MTCSVTMFNVPSRRTPVQGWNMAGESFCMEVDFASTSGALCACCEYRQYVRGTVMLNGRVVVPQLAHPNPAAGTTLPLLPKPASGAVDDNFQEDGAVVVHNNYNTFYGHRSGSDRDPTDEYLQQGQPQRADGCEYRGEDFPEQTGTPGQTYSTDIDYRGQVIDRCNGDVVTDSVVWTVTFSGTF